MNNQMKKTFLLISLLAVPMIVSGCFFSRPDNQAEPRAEAYAIYRSQVFQGFNFSARYPADWQLTEESTSAFGDFFNDLVSFAGNNQIFKVTVFYQKAEEAILSDYRIESRSQTEVSATLADNLYGALADERIQAVLAKSGDFHILITSNNPDSAEFVKFLSDFNFTKPEAEKSGNITLSLYFDDGTAAEYNCEAAVVKKATIARPSEDLGLIPEVMKLLIQLSVPEELQAEGLITAIPVNTRIRSFGYEDNKAVVNFNAELNEGGGSCLMMMRRSQIEKTLKALNEVSELEIKEVEIQVEGDSQSALQP